MTDSEGNTIMENTPNTDKGFTNVRTAYYMLDCLQNVTAHGTAYGIQLDGVETGGKTGTTTSNTDIWFCGITPKYSGAVWVGYEHNYRLDGLYGRNAAEIWLAVMQKVHAGDSGLVFDSHPQDFEEVTYCSGYRSAGIRCVPCCGTCCNRPILEGQGSDRDLQSSEYRKQV